MPKENKIIGGQVIEAKERQRNGVPVGIVKGYIATWDIDRGDYFGRKDKFVKGCFEDSIKEYVERNRQVRFKDHHERTVGGFPIDTAKQDDRGLYAEGEINLKVQQGQEAYYLAQQGVLSDFSIGFEAQESDTDYKTNIRTITKSIWWEGSIVDEPMNPEANITEVKTVVPYQDLPMFWMGKEWDSQAAIGRIRIATASEEKPSGAYKKAFLWYDMENEDDFAAYKLPICDIGDDGMMVVPRAVFAAAARVLGARDGVDIPEDEKRGVIRVIESYYERMGLDSPFKKQASFRVDDLRMSERDLEGLLKSGVCFDNEKAKIVVAALKAYPLREEKDKLLREEEQKAVGDIIADLNLINTLLKGE